MQALKSIDSLNPVIVLDEIDKIGSGSRGDPSAALLEILDPEQNNKFVDHYLNIEFDLSKVLFISNANSLNNLSAPLLDRLEIIEISGYSEEELSLIVYFCIPINPYPSMLVPGQYQELFYQNLQ